MKYLHRVIFVVLLVCPLVFAFAYVREFIAVDQALDVEHASYDYVAGRSDALQNHPYIPFSERHGILLILSGLSMLGMVGYLIAICIRRQRTQAAQPGAAAPMRVVK